MPSGAEMMNLGRPQRARVTVEINKAFPEIGRGRVCTLGCVSGATTRFITQPLDVIKLRTQIVRRGSAQVHWWQATRAVFKDEGLTAFWRGHNMGQLHSVLAVSSQFYIYEVATRYAYSKPIYHSGLKPIATFTCGLFAGTLSTAIMMPLEVVRVRQMMVKDQYKGLMNGIRRVYRYGGLPAFYSGLGTSLLQPGRSQYLPKMISWGLLVCGKRSKRVHVPVGGGRCPRDYHISIDTGPAIGISFSVFNAVQERLLAVLEQRHCAGDCHLAKGNAALPADLALASSLAGCVAGFVSKTVTYPLDLAKRRLQIASHKTKDKYKSPALSDGFTKCYKLIDCLRFAFKKEGVRGLFRGWKVTIVKAQMTNIVAFTTYELVCYAIRDFES